MGLNRGAKTWIFQIIVPVKQIEKIKLPQDWALTLLKDAARLGDLGKLVFDPKFLNSNASRAPPRPGQRPEANFRFPLNFGFVGLKTCGILRDFWLDHFARIESSGDQNPTMFILRFYVFLHF